MPWRHSETRGRGEGGPPSMAPLPSTPLSPWQRAARALFIPATSRVMPVRGCTLEGVVQHPRAATCRALPSEVDAGGIEPYLYGIRALDTLHGAL